MLWGSLWLLGSLRCLLLLGESGALLELTKLVHKELVGLGIVRAGEELISVLVGCRLLGGLLGSCLRVEVLLVGRRGGSLSLLLCSKMLLLLLLLLDELLLLQLLLLSKLLLLGKGSLLSQLVLSELLGMLLLGVHLLVVCGVSVDLDRLIELGLLSLGCRDGCLWGRCGGWLRSLLLSRCRLLAGRLLIGVDHETSLAGGVLDDALLAVGVNVSVGALDSSVIQSGLLAETLASWTTSGVVAELVVALEGGTDLDVVQFGLVSGLFGGQILFAWSSNGLGRELACRGRQLLMASWRARSRGAGNNAGDSDHFDQLALFGEIRLIGLGDFGAD